MQHNALVLAARLGTMEELLAEYGADVVAGCEELLAKYAAFEQFLVETGRAEA